MDRYDYLIIGGGIAGTTAAETIRERDLSGAVAIVSEEPHPLYSRVLLPNYVKGVSSRAQVFLRAPGDYQTKRIVFLTGSAVSLDTAARAVGLKDGRTLGFGKLLIASGGHPRQLGVPGEGLLGVSRFQTIEDADRMRTLLADSRRAVVAGSGFIALEYLEILSSRNIPTTLVSRQPYFFSRFLDPAGGDLLHGYFRSHGIILHVNDRLAAIAGEERVGSVELERGGSVPCDFVGLGIGLRRNTAWLAETGIALTPSGVATDECLETSEPGIFAAGDIADFYDVALGFRHTHGNWGNAFRQGELAGRNMADPKGRAPYAGVTSYGIRSLGFHAALVGRADGGEGIMTITRLDPDAKTYSRFFLKEDRLVGAALINRPQDRPVISTLIRDAVTIGKSRDQLADPAFDISRLIS